MNIIIYLILSSTCVLDSAAESRIRGQDAVPVSCVHVPQTMIKQKIYFFLHLTAELS